MTLLNNITPKIKASLIHLALSIILIFLIFLIITFSWFPNSLIYAGAIDGLKILVFVDLVLGPLLTFIVFNQYKKKLKQDLAIIALLQISAIISGLYLVYNERPAFQVIADDGIHLIAYSDLKIFKSEKEHTSNQYFPPAYLLDLPNDWKELPQLKVTTEFIQERPFVYRNDLYIRFEDINEKIFLTRLMKISKNKSELTLDNKPKDHPSKECEWLRLISKHNNGYACINYKNGIVDLSNKKIF